MANVGCSSHTLLQVTRRTTESTIHWNEEKPFINKEMKSNNQLKNKDDLKIHWEMVVERGLNEGGGWKHGSWPLRPA
jgi:hypothetical protein